MHFASSSKLPHNALFALQLKRNHIGYAVSSHYGSSGGFYGYKMSKIGVHGLEHTVCKEEQARAQRSIKISKTGQVLWREITS